MENEGYIKAYRKLFKSDSWLSEKFTRGQAWLDLINLANWSDGHIRVRGVKIEVKRGQCGWSILKLSERLKWSQGKVKRFLKELKNEEQIEEQNNQLSSVITIINYEEYQGNGEQNSEQTENRRRTDGEQTETINKNNNKKNNKNNNLNVTVRNSEKKDELFEQFWKLYPKKIAKQAAIKAWAKLSPDQKSSAVVALPNHITCDQWQKDGGQFIPHPATWLNSGRWEDDIEASNTHSEYGPEFQRLSPIEKRTLLKMAEQYEKNLGEVATQKHIEHWIKTKL